MNDLAASFVIANFREKDFFLEEFFNLVFLTKFDVSIVKLNSFFIFQG